MKHGESMSVAFALLTSDANLLGCELARLEGRVSLDGQGRSHVAGAGWYAQESVLLRRFPLDAAPRSTLELGNESAISEALLYASAAVDPTRPVEESAQPLRFRNWLFAQGGAVPDFARFRSSLLAMVPEFLRRQLVGDTPAEATFALFLKLLREAGRTDEPSLDAALAAQLLSRTVRAVQQLGTEAGASRPATLTLLATNGRVLVAARSGDEPLYYALLEGSGECTRCGLDGRQAELLRAHRRRRTVAIASHPLDPTGWIELPAATALAVDSVQNVQRLPL
jgi:hypothetical protein